MKFLSDEHQFMAMLIINGAAEAFAKILKMVEPTLQPLLIVGQIVIAVFTAKWIWQRARGAKLDNRLKEIEINKKEHEQ